MKTKKRTKKPSPQERLALRWATTTCTIRTWKAAGAPLDDAKAMLQWLAGQHHLPPGTEQLLHTEQRLAAAPAQGTTLATDQEGAPAALQRLQSAELQCARLYLDSLESGNPLLIRRTEKGWQGMLMTLAKYWALVQESQRLSSVQVSRSDVEGHLAWLGASLSHSAGEVANVAAHTMARCDDVTAITEGLKALLETKQHTSLAAWSLKGDVPAWMIQALTNHARHNTALGFDAWLDRLRDRMALEIGRNTEDAVQKIVKERKDAKRLARINNPCNCECCRRWRLAHGGKGNDPACPHLADREAGRSYPGSPC